MQDENVMGLPSSSSRPMGFRKIKIGTPLKRKSYWFYIKSLRRLFHPILAESVPAAITQTRKGLKKSVKSILLKHNFMEFTGSNRKAIPREPISARNLIPA